MPQREEFSIKNILLCLLIGSTSLLFQPPLLTKATSYAYQDTDWYKTQGKFAEQSAQNAAQRQKRLATHDIGLYVTNTTPYQAKIEVTKSHHKKYAGRQEKNIPAGETAELLGNALDNQYSYQITAAVKQPVSAQASSSDSPIARSMHPAAIVGSGGIGTFKQPPTATLTRFITTQQPWTSNYPTTNKLELVLELIEKPAGKPTLMLRQK